MKKRSQALASELPAWLAGGLVFGALATILWLEKRRPLRREREEKLRRDKRNLVIGAMSAAVIRLAEKPITGPLAKKVHGKRWGLLPRLNLPPALEAALAAVLLDYTLYIWHVLTHRVPILWRFHRAHHADFDLSMSTALRFHFGEMMLSVPWRAAQVVAIGTAPRSLSLWQTLTLLAILFHHANVRLPMAVERWLCRLIVTPRMHGIHHSIVEHETNSNWGTIFSLPDYLHKSIRLNVPQERIDAGIPAFRNVEELRLGHVIRMPFEKQRPTWRLRGRGPMPERREPLPQRTATLAP
jgi:sterol desaturase/sphingolipid hydroxylase (fatty acid hydroxylase superfamily)